MVRYAQLCRDIDKFEEIIGNDRGRLEHISWLLRVIEKGDFICSNKQSNAHFSASDSVPSILIIK